MLPTDFAITQAQAIAFGLLTLPVTLWIIWTDLTEMKIRNEAVLAMVALFAVAGPLLLPSMGEFAWRWLHLAVMLAFCFLFYLTVGMGAGDAKYIAAAALFVPLADAGSLAWLYVIWSVILLVGMTIAKRSPALRTAAPGWVWFAPERRGFVPFGLALAPTLTTYFALAATAG